MYSEVAVAVERLSKCYHLYDKPHDRLLQMLMRGRKQYFREHWALRDVSFEICKGETVGIIGRNGSGKSTLLQLICGTLNPTGGSVRTVGRVAALLELGSGFNPEFTGRENVYMNAAVLGLSREETEQRFQDIAAFADIGDFIDQPVKTYSSGMVVRLAFAVIAHVEADVLIVDEALAVGDAFFTQKCMRFLRDFMQAGTVLFVSHDTAAVKALCNRAIRLDSGQVVDEGAPKDVCDRYLQAFFEAQQGRSNSKGSKNIKRSKVATVRRDPRADLINASNLRNDLRVFSFDPDAASFGKGGAQISNVDLLDESDQPLSWVVGGERVTLRIVAHAYQDLDSPIIGFYVRDRLGQALFGDNTFLLYKEQPIRCATGSTLEARFTFNMPILPVGEYSITTAIANGTIEAHEQHHWMHDAMVFRSESSSIASGMIGIPMLEVELTAA